jgi:hypothetical protein
VARDRVDATRESYETSLRQMRTLLDAQASLREVAEQRAARSRAELERLAEALCPHLVDDLRRRHPLGLSQIEARYLTDAVTREVQRRLARLGVAEVAGQSIEELYEEATAELVQLRGENARLQGELDDAQEECERVTLRLKLLQQSLEDAERRIGGLHSASSIGDTDTPARAWETAAVPAEELPDWLSKWRRQNSHERDLVLLSVLAETGVASRDEAAHLFAIRLELKPGSSSVKRAFERFQAKLGLIEIIDCGPDEQANSGQELVRLTERGRDACRLLLGLEPVPSQATELLARHGSANRVGLSIEAATLLTEAGYEVDLLPATLHLPGNRGLRPDLLACRQGRTLTVAVETGRPTQGESADSRWQDYRDAGGGQLYVVVPNKQALDNVKSEILFCMGTRDAVLWMADLSAPRGKRGDAVWSFKRGKPT